MESFEFTKTAEALIKDALLKQAQTKVTGAKPYGKLNVTQGKKGFTAKQIYSVPATQVGGTAKDGNRYYQGSGTARSMSVANSKASFNALRTMASSPADSIRARDLLGQATPTPTPTPTKKKMKIRAFGRGAYQGLTGGQ